MIVIHILSFLIIVAWWSFLCYIFVTDLIEMFRGK